MNTMGGCKEVAELLGVTAGRVRTLCQQGRVVGAEQIGAGWVIPLPVSILPAPAKHRRPGAIDAATALPGFLAKRLPRAKGVPG